MIPKMEKHKKGAPVCRALCRNPPSLHGSVLVGACRSVAFLGRMDRTMILSGYWH